MRYEDEKEKDTAAKDDARTEAETKVEPSPMRAPYHGNLPTRDEDVHPDTGSGKTKTE